MTYTDPTLYTLILTVMCVLLLVFLVAQLLLALRNKNKLVSWSTCFYLLCLLWTVVRSTYWIMIQTRKSMTYLELYLLYWFPTPIQFANFSLLVLFYIQVITGKQWRTRWRNICLPLYFLMTMSMTTFTAVWAFNSSNDISNAYQYGDEYDQEFYKVSDVSVQLEYSAVSFFMLSFLFGFFGWKMATVESWKRRRLLISKPRSLAIINSLLFLIFFTRSMRDLATSQNWFLSIWNQLDINGRVTSFYYFVFFCFWEFLPTILLLLLITTKAGGVQAPRHGSFISQGKLPDFGIFHIINTTMEKRKDKLLASPLPGYGSGAMDSSGARRSSACGSGGSRGSGTGVRDSRTRSGSGGVDQQPRWTHGGDLFQDPLRYDSDDGLSPQQTSFPDSLTSESALNDQDELQLMTDSSSVHGGMALAPTTTSGASNGTERSLESHAFSSMV